MEQACETCKFGCYFDDRSVGIIAAWECSRSDPPENLEDAGVIVPCPLWEARKQGVSGE